jgi:hypothetical protein
MEIKKLKKTHYLNVVIVIRFIKIIQDYGNMKKNVL